MAFYRVLLRLYPASFRAEYGDEMAAVFAARRREAEGILSTVALWTEALADVALNAFHAHADVLRQDLAYAARAARRAPGFALTTVAVAALGVGATTAAFSIADHVLLRPLPFRDPARLVDLWQDQGAGASSRMELSPANYRDWKREGRSFETMGALAVRPLNLSGDGDPERVEAAAVTAEVLPLLGVAPAWGRVFGADDMALGAPATVVLGHGLWQARFGGDRGVLGRRLLLDGVPHTVVGVMPPGFHYPSRDAELWTPLRFAEDAYDDRTDCYLRAIARLRAGVSLDAARAEMRVIAARLARTYPKTNAGMGANVVRPRDEMSAQARLLPMALLGAAACVLLIACTNLTSLLLARALVRRKELAVRAALGAGRERLVRQLLTESLLLTLAGGALGLALAVAAAPVLARLVPNALPIAAVPGLDLRVLAFAALVTAATGIGFGVLPAWRACGAAGASGLQEGPRAGVGGRRERVRSLLVVAEVTACVVLLVSCGLLLRALWRLQSVDPGFEADGVLTLRTALPQPKYERTALRNQFYTRVLSDVRALPGVTSAAYISFLPMVMRGGIWPVILPGQPRDPASEQRASLRYATPRFFAALRIPIRAGRDVSPSDTSEAPFVAVVSESFARRHWPGQDPLGRRFQFALADRTVVGVVGDIRVRGPERASEPQVYLPSTQVPDGWIIGYTPRDLVVRASGHPEGLAPAIRAIVRRADAQQPVSDVRMLADIVADETASRRVQVRVLAGFAAVAFFLAGIGIHGLLSFAVSSRAQEIGVRMALGARAGHIVAMVLGQGSRLALAGVGIGVGTAYVAGRAMEALLAGVRPADGPTFLAAVVLSALMTLLGSALPALRALRVDPMVIMRME